MDDWPLVFLRHPRTEVGPDPYVRAATEHGYTAICKPVLRFEFLSPPPLHTLLARPDDYAGLLITSPRAVKALHRCLDSASHLSPTTWLAKPTYVVGPRTATVMHDMGGTPVGAGTGNAEALSEKIKTDAPGKLLFLSGNRRRDTLPRALVQNQQPYDEVVVYRTHTRTHIDLPDPPACLAFFSPSGLEAVHASGYDLSRYQCAAIGPTTAQALHDQGLSVDAIADTPTPQGMLQAVEQAAMEA